MVGCSTAIAAMAGGRIGELAFARDSFAASATDEIIVVVFLRGGCDGLSLVAPFQDGSYVTQRGFLAIPGTSSDALTTNNASYNTGFRLHPQAGPLKELYDARKLAIVHACGLNDDTRSHFDAMDYMERGTPGNKNTSTGWLTRHLQSAGVSGVLPTLAASSSTPASLLNHPEAVAMASANDFKFIANSYQSQVMTSLKKMYGGTTAFQTVGSRTLETIETLSTEELNYTPLPGIAYPDNTFGNAMKMVAQMIKLDLGLRVATVDYGGWDTHDAQGNGADANGYFARMTGGLARGLHAFYNDLPQHQSKLTVVVMSEFGRRLGTNASGGTDHGHGNAMLVLGGQVNGGAMYGSWPGLIDLDQSQDLKITTDYRTVLSEIVVRRLGNPYLGKVFPGLNQYSPLGITGSAAEDLPINYSSGHSVYLPLTTH